MTSSNFELSKGSGVGFSTSVFDDSSERYGGYANGPERALMSALLFDGIQSYIHYALPRNPSERAHFSEAFNWVMDKGTEYPLSFNNVCEALGIEPEYLRYGLTHASVNSLSALGDSRRNEHA